jgi:hypothetical protein
MGEIHVVSMKCFHLEEHDCVSSTCHGQVTYVEEAKIKTTSLKPVYSLILPSKLGKID